MRHIGPLETVAAALFLSAALCRVSGAQEPVRSKLKSQPTPVPPVNCPDILHKLSVVQAASRLIQNPSDRATYDDTIVRAQENLAAICINGGGGGSGPGSAFGARQSAGDFKNGVPGVPAVGSAPSASSPAPLSSDAFGKTYPTRAGTNNGEPVENSTYGGNDGGPLPQPAAGQAQLPQNQNQSPSVNSSNGAYSDYYNSGRITLQVPTPKDCPGKDEPLSYPVGPGYIAWVVAGNVINTYKIKRPNRMDYVRDWYWTIPGAENAFVATQGQFVDGGDVIYLNLTLINSYFRGKQFHLFIRNMKTGAYLDHQGIFVAVNSFNSGCGRPNQPGAPAEMCKAVQTIGSNAALYSTPLVSVDRKDPNKLHPIRFFDPGTGLSDPSCRFLSADGQQSPVKDCMLKLDPDGSGDETWPSNWQDMAIAMKWGDNCSVVGETGIGSNAANAENPPTYYGKFPHGASNAGAKYPTCPSIAITTLWTPDTNADPSQPHCTLPETSLNYDGWCYIPAKPYPCRANKYGSYSCDYDMNDWPSAEICAKKCNTTAYAMGMKCTSRKAMGGWVPELSNHCEPVSPHEGCQN